MRKSHPLFLALGVAFALAARAEDERAGGPETVVVPSGALELRAVLWRPQGRCPFPAVVFNHGNGHATGMASGRRDQRHPELLGPVFARRG
jgi:hypothetical protein